ncbi:MAG: response regulator [Pseudomonadota bacterium]
MELSEAEKYIKGKRVLIVDDEVDVLDSLSELLVMCRIDMASSFEKAKEYLENNFYEIAVLDIMGVNGYELLEIANERDIPALMLTAHALSEEDLKKSAQKGASYYAPKDRISDIPIFIADVLEARDAKKNPWVRWLERLGSFYDKCFGGKDWREKEREFLEKKFRTYL